MSSLTRETTMPKKTRLLTRDEIEDPLGHRSVWLKETISKGKWVPMHEMWHNKASCVEDIREVQAQHPPQNFDLRPALYVRAEEEIE